jgi:DNA polymerase-3 subunit beta
MKFKIKADELKVKLEVLNKAIRAKSTIPIMGTFKMELFDGNLSITASDLEISISTDLTPVEVIDDGSVCAPADVLLNTIKGFKNEILEFSVSEKHHIELSTEHGVYNLCGVDPEDYPIPRALENAYSFNVSPFNLRNAIDNTLFAASIDVEFEPMMAGVYFDLTRDQVKVAATNRQRIAECWIGEPMPKLKKGLLMPIKMASILSGSLNLDEPYVSVKFDESNAIADTGDYIISAKRTEGNFPDYDSVLPEINATVSLPTESLKDAIGRIKVYANQKSKIIVFSFTENLLTISGEDKDFGLSAIEAIPLDDSSIEFEMRVNFRLFSDILSKINTDEIVFKFAKDFPHCMVAPGGDNEYEFFYFLAGIATL